MPEGVVTWFNADKGFGFLAPDDGGPDVFLHVTALADDESLFALAPGERVEYQLEHGDRGPLARDVRPAGAPPISRDSRSARMARTSGGGRSTGVVAWFNAEKGFGFLRPDDGSADVFVHWKAISGDGGFRTLADGQRVEYERTSGDRGPQALDVRRV
ncbi:MAG: cold-shock DNA-binding domain protein [Frankiales bacterium]|nr:cold-shock DNA-binding domain protein [Frankiales bacterium]